MDEPRLPLRPADGHKGTFGTVCVVGGQASMPRMMIGGPAFAALGALRVGAGLVTLAVPAPIAAHALQMVPSATALPLPTDQSGTIIAAAAASALDTVLPSVDALAIGPGLGVGVAQRQLVARLLSRDDVTMILDADALNALADIPSPQVSMRATAILTPHPGEWRRLAAALAIDGDPTADDSRPAAAESLARRLGAVVVLKGARTVVTDGIRTWISPHASAVLAVPGSGDVLTGVIAGLVAQWGRGPASQLSPFEAACLAVGIHAEAAALWSAQHGDAGMLATELAAAIPDALLHRTCGD